jgi:hypothetical protein
MGAKESIGHCAFQGCDSPVPKDQDCWGCGKPYCDNHRKMHSRCMKWILCANCWDEHLPWCETHEQHRGPLTAEKELGTGEEYVYIYYSKTEFENAQLQRRDRWLCKIGRTAGDLTVRIVLQSALTAHPEVPTIALALHTDDSKSLERLIHTALSYAGRHQKGAPGSEWFLTNPIEVETLYHSIEHMRRSLEISPLLEPRK